MAVKAAAKWLWIFIILLFVIYYAWPRREGLLQAVETLGWLPVCFSLLLIVISKIGLVENMRIACASFGIHLGWWDCFRIYNHTQLAKYVPGSIWQFVGRIAILNTRGYEGRTIRDALIAEHFWVILVAGALAISTLMMSDAAYIALLDNSDTLLEQWHKIKAWSTVFLTVASIMAVTAIWRWIKKVRSLTLWFIGLMPSGRVIAILLLTWALFGASLWITILPFSENLPPYSYILGVYCLAYVIGFLALFAPAGLGIREVVLVLGLSILVNSDTALLLASVNRLIYFSSEIVLAAIAAFGNLRKAK